MERVLEVTPGCQVLWDFTIGKGEDAGAIGKVLNSATGESTDLVFQVKFLPDLSSVEAADAASDGQEHVVDIVEPTTVDDSHSRLTGKTVIDRNGLVAIMWSNRGSWVRSRVLRSFSLVVNRLDDDVGSFK